MTLVSNSKLVQLRDYAQAPEKKPPNGGHPFSSSGNPFEFKSLGFTGIRPRAR
jgi:hypothetical protein